MPLRAGVARWRRVPHSLVAWDGLQGFPRRQCLGRAWATSRTLVRAWENLGVKDEHKESASATASCWRRGRAKAQAFAAGGAGPQRQDVWANIWCAVLAVVGRLCVCVTVARPGGAAVALAEKTLHCTCAADFKGIGDPVSPGPRAGSVGRGSVAVPPDRCGQRPGPGFLACAVARPASG